MEKHERELRKRHSSDQLSTSNVTPRRQRSSSYHTHSKILQDESLPSTRSLQIDKSVVHHLDSMAATPGNVRLQHVLSETTDVSNITMTPRWQNYLDRTYYLRSVKRSQSSVSGDSSVIEGSGNLEDMFKSPGKGPHFQRRRRHMIPKEVGTELFRAALTRSTRQSSVILPPQPKGGDEISVESLEEATPIVSQPFKRRRNLKTNPSLFHDAFEGFAISSPNSVEDVSNRHEISSDRRNDSSSPQRSPSNRSGNKHVQELEQESDVTSPSTSPNRRQIKSTDVLPSHSGQTKNAAFTRSTRQSSLVLPPQPKGGDEISLEGLEEASPVVSQPFKRRRNVKTNPSVFQDAFADFVASASNSEGSVSKRHEISSDMMNDSSSQQRSRSTRSGDKRVQELEQQSDVTSPSTSPNRRQIKSTDILPSHSGQTKNAAFTRSTRQSSVILPPQPKGGDEISLEGLEEASPIVSQPFKRKGNVKMNPSVFHDAFADFVTSATNSEGNVSKRHEVSSDMKNESSSPQRSRSTRSGTKRVQELEQLSDVPSNSASPNRRQTKSTDILPSHSAQTKNASLTVCTPQSNKSACDCVHMLEQQSHVPKNGKSFYKRQDDLEPTNVLPRHKAVFTRSTRQSSVILPPQPRGGDEISVEGLEEASPVVSQPFKRRRNIKTSPSIFQSVLGDFVTSFPNSEEDVSNRHEISSDRKNESSSPQTSRSTRSGNKRVQELEQQSDVPSNSESPNRRQTQSTDVLPSHSAQIKNAALTRSTRQSSVILPPQPKGSDEISAEDLEEASPILSQPFKRRRTVKTNPSLFQDAFADFVASATESVEDPSNRHEDLRQTKDGSATANASQSKKETGHVPTLVERSNVPSNSASFNKQQSEMESVGIHQGVSSGTEQNKMQSTSNKSVRLQNVAWFRRWQEKAAATGNACAFNLLSREERTAKLEEFVRDVKKKHDAAFKSGCTTNRPFNRKLEETENIKVTERVPKKKLGKKPLRADLLVDGKPYRPRLKRPKSWATPRLYKLIIKKCEEKYGTLKAHRKAQEFVVHLCEKVSTVIRRKKYESYQGILEEIKKALYRLGVIKCLMEYFVFIEDYLPFEYRIKAVPCLRAYGKNTGPPLAPDTDLFADLGY